MSRTRTAATGGRSRGGRHAGQTAAGRSGKRGYRLLAGGLAAATTASGLIGLATIAQAGTPPMGPGNIEIFNKRSMVALEGYTAQAGQEATVEVIRAGEVVGIGVGTLDATGFLEFNHPGGECWIGVTPNIKPGDEVKVSFSGASFTDSAITASPTVTKVQGLGFTPGTNLPTDPENRVRGEGKVVITGTYDPTDPWWDPARFNIETVNPENDDDKTPPGEDPGLSDNRAMGISLVPDAEHPNGEPGLWDAEATADPASRTITGTYTLYTEADYDRVLEGDHVFAAWMAGEEPALGLTQNEFEEIPGPGMGGCPPSPDGRVPTAPTTAALSSAAGSTSVGVTWQAPAQPADAPEITGYRVAAIGGTFTEQEVAERTGGTAVSLDGLQAGATYEITIEAFNGRWSAAQSVGTIQVGSGTGTGGGTEEPPPPPEPSTEAPAAPAGVTATTNAAGGADVSWTASDGATSYTVSASSTAPGAATPAPVTVQAPTTAASLSGLTPGTEYTVSVTASNAAGTSAGAGTTTVTTAAAVAPGPFTLTRVVPGHESVTAEWTAAQPGNAASPVTGYELVATPPADSTTATEVRRSFTGTSGTLTGLLNGVEYTVSVIALSGTASTTGSVGTNVDTTVAPNDVVTVTRATYRADRREYRILGTAQDVTANRVHLRLGTVIGSGTTIQLNVPVNADGTWSVDLRNGPTLPTNNRFNVVSDSGAGIVALMTRVR